MGGRNPFLYRSIFFLIFKGALIMSVYRSRNPFLYRSIFFLKMKYEDEERQAKVVIPFYIGLFSFAVETAKVVVGLSS